MRSEALDAIKDATVLFAEDDPVVRKEIADILGFYCKTLLLAENGEMAFRLFQEHRVDILITDAMMHGMDGLELIGKIRAHGAQVPVIVVTSYTSESLLLRAVTLKLTGYIKKPCTLQHIKEGLALCGDELLASAPASIELDHNVAYNAANALLLVRGESISLTKKENRLLCMMVENRNGLLSKERIVDYVWEGEYASDNACKNLVLRLRKKIGADKVVSVKGLGYKLRIAARNAGV